MQISFQHANPTRGNESVLLRFVTGADETPCILIDAGPGVDLDSLLQPTDRLAAICLTHAHLDHYATLAAAHYNEVPILTSPATAAVLNDVLNVASTEYDIAITGAVTDAITPVDDWTEVTPTVEVHPVPAGHVPGAVGFLVRAANGDQNHHLLVTGDFTLRSAGGFPGFDPGGFVDVDVLFLSVPTNDSFKSALTDALGMTLEQAHSGAPTLLATSGLVGVQCAYLLTALINEYNLQVPVRVVGHVAKLYEALDYDCSSVEVIPDFEHTDECLDQGTIVIAGPEVPREQSSGRLFGVLREDSNACVVQLVGCGEKPLTDGKCTIHAYELANHPTRETLIAVHDAVEPTETIITHCHGGAQDAFNDDLSSIIWACGNTNEHTLFDGQYWRLPPWMNGRRVNCNHRRNIQQFAGADLLASFSIPSLDRYDEPDLEGEGVDIKRIETRLHRSPDTAISLDTPTHGRY